MAENEYDSSRAAIQAQFDVFECVARKAKTLDPKWNDAIPYNSDDSRTCSEILPNKMHVSHPGSKSIKSPTSWEVKAAVLSNTSMSLAQPES
jgi:hypothetical protein